MKAFAQMTAHELVTAVKRLLERDDLSYKAANVAALVAIITWEEARDRVDEIKPRRESNENLR